MFLFLQLPPEIRRIFIKHALFNKRPAPEYHSKENRAGFLRYMARPRAQPYHEIRTTHSPSNSLDLRFTCKEVPDETKAILAHHGPRYANYHLDISVENDNDVLPTWLCVPFLTTHLDKLYVDIRLYGTVIHPEVARWQRGDGGHTRYEWDFLALLEQFLRYGPVGRKRISDDDQSHQICRVVGRNIKVDTMILNFTSGEDKLQPGEFPPEEITYRHWRSYRRVFCLGRGAPELDLPLTYYNTRPEWLAELLEGEIEVLLNFGLFIRVLG